MDGREKRDGIEIDAPQVSAGFGLSKNSRHDYGAQNLADQFVEDLRDGRGTTVKTDGCEIQDPREEDLRRQIIEHVDDADAARVEAEPYHIRVFEKRRPENPPIFAKRDQQQSENDVSSNRAPDRRHEA